MENRLKEVIAYSRRNVREFASECGISYATLYSCVIGRRKINVEMVQKILAAYPEVEEGWLILGRGDMLSEKTRVALKRIV